ncbi:DUF397 domain-containing protein [Streptosporangium sp. OZ121]|uniref:DUF397 domain-containing protein n=1 Tax=Streptosporangium sp. OZ121 TaxID=3444183 RepID=UPI003F78B2B7
MDLTDARWFKSSRSGGNGGDGVEAATNLPGIVAVRDSKNPDGPTLAFTPEAWADFITSVKADTI